MSGYLEDEGTETEYKENLKQLKEIVELKYCPVNEPFAGAANIKDPMTANAVNQFMSRMTGSMVKNGRLLESRQIGMGGNAPLSELSDKVDAFISYLLLEDRESSWEDHNDKTVYSVGLNGLGYKKTYFDFINETIRSEDCLIEDVVVNKQISDLDHAPRVTHRYWLSRNKIQQKVRIHELLAQLDYSNKSSVNQQTDPYSDDNNELIEMLEQHTYLDLDDDGLDEPYYITMYKDTSQVAGIKPRFTASSIKRTPKGEIYEISAEKYFTDFGYMPAPDGGFHKYGLGQLLYAQNKSVNIIANNLINAGTLYNQQLILLDKGARLEGGVFQLPQGSVQPVQVGPNMTLEQSIHPLPVHEPSQILAELLQTIKASAKELTATSDALSGNVNPQYTKSTALQQLIQQGLTVFTSVQKRLFRSYRREFQKIFDLVIINLDTSPRLTALAAQFDLTSDLLKQIQLNISPVADPSEADFYRRQQQSMELQATAQLPGMGPALLAINEQIIQNSDLDNKAQLIQILQAGANQPPQATPEQQYDEHLLKLKAEELILKQQELDLKKQELGLKAITAKTGGIKNLADAHAVNAGVHLDAYSKETDRMAHDTDKELREKELTHQAQNGGE